MIILDLQCSSSTRKGFSPFLPSKKTLGSRFQCRVFQLILLSTLKSETVFVRCIAFGAGGSGKWGILTAMKQGIVTKRTATNMSLKSPLYVSLKSYTPSTGNYLCETLRFQNVFFHTYDHLCDNLCLTIGQDSRYQHSRDWPVGNSRLSLVNTYLNMGPSPLTCTSTSRHVMSEPRLSPLHLSWLFHFLTYYANQRVNEGQEQGYINKTRAL